MTVISKYFYCYYTFAECVLATVFDRSTFDSFY